MERWPRIVLHADMDAFYAAVEQLDDPSLRGKPVIVGPNSDRGVVLTASYEARPFNLGSAMPMAWVRRRCPQAIVVPPRFERYTELSTRVMEVFDDFSPAVEPLSLDEAFLDMTGATSHFGTPEQMGRRLKASVREATGGLAVSIGASGTKYVAKVASDYGKPDGLLVVPPDRARQFLAPLPVTRLWGVGPKTAPRFERAGLRTIGDVALASDDQLQAAIGNMGGHFQRMARAEDPRQVSRGFARKSVGSNRTLERDVRTREEVCRQLRRSAESVAGRLRAKQLLARGVVVRLKTSSHQGMTRQCRLPAPTDVAATLYEAGEPLLDRFPWDEAFRLVGLSAIDLVRAQEGGTSQGQMDLFAGPARDRRVEEALDLVRARYGHKAAVRATDLEHPGGPMLAPTLDGYRDEILD